MTDEKNTHDDQPARKRGQRKGKARRRGSGSVFRRPERKGGKEWVAQIILEDGKTKQRYFKTQAEADIALNEMLYEQRRGMLATGPNQTLKQFMEYWLDEVHKPAIRISSYVNYRSMLNNHILPELGHYRLRQLTVQHMESFYAKKAKQGLSANTLKVIHGMVHNALAHAVYLNLVARNVADIAKKSLPRQTRYEIQPLTREQAQKLLEQARGEKSEALLILAISTGMRRGELAALRWSDIHLEEGYLQVQRSARYAGKGYGLQITEPKTRSSRRKIVLSSLVVEALLAHRARQDKIREAAGDAWQAHNLIFCDRHGEYLDPDTLRNWLKKLLKEAGLPSIRFHDLRHSAATLLMERGVHAKVVQELLGHSSIMMTLDIYSHVLPSLQEHTKEKLDDLFNDQGPDKSKGDDQQDAEGKHGQAT
jgi:integrase